VPGVPNRLALAPSEGWSGAVVPAFRQTSYFSTGTRRMLPHSVQEPS
jgi:hypothetical protein